MKTMKAKKEEGEFWKAQIVRTFSEETTKLSHRLFATELQDGDQVHSNEFPSTNILSLLVKAYSEMNLLDTKRGGTVALNGRNWEILSYKGQDERVLYQARFRNNLIPVLSLIGRGKNKLPKWMKKHMRPSRVEDAESCVPPGVSCPGPVLAPISKDRSALLYDSIDSALKMECAFYLERQFCFVSKSSVRHWYDHNFQEMVLILQKHHLDSS
jgi:hypothetical protein